MINEAICQAMADLSLEELRSLLAQDGAFRDLLSGGYVGGEPEPPPLDSEEAAELVTLTEQTMDRAALRWGALSPEQRAPLLAIAEDMGGNPEDLEMD